MSTNGDNLIVEADDLAELYECAGLGLLDALGAFERNAEVSGELEVPGWITAEGEGEDPTETLVDWLNFLLEQYHDYGFLPERIDVVKVIDTRAGTRIYGGYLPPRRDVPLLAIREIGRDRLLLRKIAGRWRVEIGIAGKS